jgi:hypothetical protein
VIGKKQTDAEESESQDKGRNCGRIEVHGVEIGVMPGYLTADG